MLKNIFNHFLMCFFLDLISGQVNLARNYILLILYVDYLI